MLTNGLCAKSAPTAMGQPGLAFSYHFVANHAYPTAVQSKGLFFFFFFFFFFVSSARKKKPAFRPRLYHLSELPGRKPLTALFFFTKNECHPGGASKFVGPPNPGWGLCPPTLLCPSPQGMWGSRTLACANPGPNPSKETLTPQPAVRHK